MEASLDIVDQTEMLSRPVDGHHVLIAARELGIGTDFAIDSNVTSHQNQLDLAR